MSSDADMRRLAREVLAELVPELAAAVPQAPSPPVALVPAPPVAAVLRPSTWAAAAVPGELVGDGPPASAASAASAAPESDAPAPATPGSDRPAPAPPPGEHRTVVVTMHDNEDLDRFVRALIRRLENPRDRLAIRTGRLRLRPSTGRARHPRSRPPRCPSFASSAGPSPSGSCDAPPTSGRDSSLPPRRC